MFSKFCTFTFKTAAALLILALLGSLSAHAAKEKFERNKPHVNVGMESPPLALDIVMDNSGRIEGAIRSLYKSTNLTLKRGVVSALADGSVEATYATQLSQHIEDGVVTISDLTVELQGAADDICCLHDDDGDSPIILFDIATAAAHSQTKPEFKYVPIRRIRSAAEEGSDDEGDMILFASTRPVHEDVPVVIVSFNFEEIKTTYSTEQLWGEPAYLFNTPDPDEDLVATIPMPFPGETIIEELIVYSTERSEPLVIQIQLQYIF